ncbi:TonB-dependent receptor domain-containing protein [Pseudoxanthomonas winnipegensis]|uniref:TonB-dependent receptor domain-containing protein n=1 Tax=Pseudoxanthomonas winnipegensis TaxID=2480810 RepID=UPI00103B2F68|nr:TonB-dependent receptor [Pseudoxanthomonas winnipegensis]TBV75790.1 TonB-dependent receptor [Pseudoxanthomonas winnipegensis]
MKNKHAISRSPSRSILAIALAGCMVASVPAFAQSSNATLRGKAESGADVTATNTATGLSRRVTASADGSYALVGLPPGTYKIQAGGVEKTVTLAVATSVSLDMQAANAAPAGDAKELDTVRVKAPPLQEVKTSEVGTNVSLQQINSVPQLTRNFLEFADTVPGMQFTTDSSGHSDIRGGAQQTSAVNVYIDGVGQKSYLFGGVSGQQQSAGNPFPQLAIGEYKVITSNYKAEFDQVGSAAIVAATKSGTNEFHGEVFGRMTNSDWRKPTPAEEQSAGGKQKTHQNEYGFALGGPIIQDKMHFFVSYEGKGFEIPADPVAVNNNNFLSYSDDLPASVQAKYGPITRPFNEDLYFGKIDWEIGDNDRLELTAKVRREDSIDTIGGPTTAQAAKINNNRENRYDLKWEHYGDGFFNEARVTYEDVLFNPTARTIGSRLVYTARQNQDDLLIEDGATSGLSIQRKGQKGPAFQDDLTFNSFSWHGDHVIKMGVKYKDVELTQSENSTVNPSFYYAVTDGAGTAAIPYQVVFNQPYEGFSPSVTTKDKQIGLYIQDDWDVNDKLQLNLGVRWDYEKVPSYTDYQTPQAVVDAINSQDPNAPAGQTYAQTLAKSGLDINDYISTGKNRKAQKGDIAPRLGFSYDFNADQRWVMFGGAGRSYDRNLYDYLGLEQVKGALSQYTVKFIESGACTTLVPQQCVNWNPSYLSGIDAVSGLVVDPTSRSGTEVDMLNNDLKTPYSDQFSLGLRHQMGDWNTSATLAYVHSKDGFAFTLGSRYPDGSFWQNGSQPWGNTAAGLGSIILGDNGIETKTKQVLLSADKPYTKESGWAFSAAYTFSDAKGNRGGDEHYSFDAATIHDYPYISLQSVPKHRLVLTGTYDLPWEISLSGKLTLATTQPLNVAVTPDAWGATPGPAYVAALKDLPGQKFLVGGPIFGTRQFDLSASKDMHVTENVTVQVRADVINVFNWDNLSSYFINYGSGGVYSPVVTYNDTNTAVSYTSPRTVFLSARVIW